MKNFFYSFLSGMALMAMLGMLTGCETSDHGSSANNNYYYGGGYNYPYYYGDYDDDRNLIVVPPLNGRPDKPDNDLRPTHPIAEPPQVRPAPMPSIPVAPRPAFRGGGGRR